MKKLCVLAIFLILFNSLNVLAAQNIKLFINGKEINTDVQPMIVNSRTIVPMRAVLEALGADVSWVPTEKKAVISEHEHEIIMYPDSDTASVNGEDIKLDCPAKIVGGRVMIPVRFVAETLGADVSWDSDESKVVINKQMNKITLKSINAVQNGNYMNISAVFDGEVESYSDFKLTNDGKNRIVVDIDDAAVGNVSSIDVSNGNVQRVRCGQFKANPYVTRIVVDVYSIASYSVQKNGSTIILSIENKQTAVVPPQNNPQKPTNTGTWDGSVKLNDEAKNLLVYIDPGHGGKETGAIANKGLENEVCEKDINLAISLYLNDMLKAAGVKTAMTRTDDSYVSLYDRPVNANDIDASLFLSVHSNSFNNDVAEGTETLYFVGGRDSYGISGEEFAKIIQKEVVAEIGTFDRGIVNGSEMYVIRKSAMPAVIAEIAFVSNPDDLYKLTNTAYQMKTAHALCRATIKALNIMAANRN